MRSILAAVIPFLLLTGQPGFPHDGTLERMLRAQVFNKLFDGFDFYRVVIEDDQPQADGSREVTAVAIGKFLENTKSMKVLFLIVGDQVVGGQVLEDTGLPPCVTPEPRHSSSL